MATPAPERYSARYPARWASRAQYGVDDADDLQRPLCFDSLSKTRSGRFAHRGNSCVNYKRRATQGRGGAAPSAGLDGCATAAFSTPHGTHKHVPYRINSANNTTASITAPNSNLKSVPRNRPRKAAMPIAQLWAGVRPARSPPRSLPERTGTTKQYGRHNRADHRDRQADEDSHQAADHRADQGQQRAAAAAAMLGDPIVRP